VGISIENNNFTVGSLNWEYLGFSIVADWSIYELILTVAISNKIYETIWTVAVSREYLQIILNFFVPVTPQLGCVSVVAGLAVVFHLPVFAINRANVYTELTSVEPINSHSDISA